MQLRQVELKPLGQGHWAIYWLGNLVGNGSSAPEDPSFWVQFESDEVDPETNRPRTKALALAAGFLPSLHVGRSWKVENVQNVSYRYRQPVRRATLELDIGRPCPIAPASTWISKNDYPLDQGLHTPCALIDAGEFYLAISVIELGRFYWGTSSRLMQALVTGRLNDPNKLVWPHDVSGSIETGFRTDGSYQLVLCDELLYRDAWVISRLLLDPIARDSAKNIHGVLLADAINQNVFRSRTESKPPTVPLTLFPFKGRTKLNVRGIWLNRRRGGKRVFLALVIDQCSHPFPVGELHVARRNPTPTPDGTGTSIPISVSISTNESDDDDEGSPLELVNTVPTERMRHRRINLPNTRFPWLKDKSLHPLITRVPEPIPKPYVASVIEVSGVSTAPGSSAENNTQRLNIQTHFPSEPAKECTTEATPLLSREHHAQFELIVQAATHLSSKPAPRQESGQSENEPCDSNFVRDWCVRLPEAGEVVRTAYQTPVCSRIPQNAPDNWWCLGKAPRSAIRLCQWVELSTKKGYFYIFELQPDKSPTAASTATYVLSLHNAKYATDSALIEYVNRLIVSKTARQADGMESRGWRRRSVKHMPDSDEKNLGSRILLAMTKLHET